MTSQHEHNVQMLKHTSTVKYGTKQGVLNIDAEIESRSSLKAHIDSSVTWPGHSYAFKETLEEKSPKGKLRTV